MRQKTDGKTMLKIRVAMIYSLVFWLLSCEGCFSEKLNEQHPIYFENHISKNAMIASPPKSVIFEQKGSNILFANRHIGMEFVTIGRRLILSNIYGIEASQCFISPDPKIRSSLWKLTFRQDVGKSTEETVVSGLDNATTSFSLVRTNEKEATLVLNWKGLRIKEEEDKIDVEVKICLKEDQPLSAWRINVNNRSKIYGLWCVHFPVLKLVPIGVKAKDNFFVTGKSRGVLVKNPFQANARSALQSGSVWPGGLNMQFQALYDSSGNGLYLASHDGNGYKKDFHFSTAPNNFVMEYKIGHYPPNMGFPREDYHMSYDVVVGSFKGDWYDAAQIYRKWALKQQWCQKGFLLNRQDIPAWFKETPIMLKITSDKGEKSLVELGDRTIKFLKFIGSELPINWYTWKKHMPEYTSYNSVNSQYRVPDRRHYPVSNIHDGNYPDFPALSGFDSTCDAISKAGGHVLPYVCARLYDQGINENAPFAKGAKQYTMKNVNGNIAYGNKGLVWTMCYHTKWWQERLKNTVVSLIKKEHAGGIYFDTMYGGYVQCFDTKHGHAYGGGNDPYIGAKKISSVLRNVMKSVDPDAVMTGESPAETAIDFLDGFQYRWSTWPDMIPLFATVYGDVIPRYGLNINPRSDGFFIQCAVLFVEGAIMGRLPLHGDDWLKNYANGSAYTKKMEYLRKLAKYRRKTVGGNYLVYGRLLRPLKFISMDPDLSVSYNEPKQRYKKVEIKTLPLQSGVFEAHDGSIGIFVVNVTDTPISFQFDLPADKYPLPYAKFIEVVRIDENGEKHYEGKHKTGVISIKRQIDGLDVVFLSIRASKDR